MASPEIRRPSIHELATSRRVGVLVAALVVVVVAVPYAALGPGFIVDDWRFLNRRELYGPLGAAGEPKLMSRPGSWATVNLLHGVVGPRPLAVYAAQTALNAGVAVALYLVGRRFVAPGTALALAVVWAILPNHTALSYWPSVANATLALLLLVVAVGLLDAGRWPAAAACLVVAALCYEVALAPAVVAVLAFTWRGRVGVVPAAVTVGALGASGAWMLANPTYPTDRPFADLRPVPAAHFAGGIVAWPATSGVLAAAAIAGLVAVAVRVLRRRAAREEHLVLAGLVLIPVGVAAFVRHNFPIVGIGDRAYTVSAVGAAMVWVGLGAVLWRRSPVAAAVAGALFVVAVAPANLDRQRAYSRAVTDALAVTEYVQHRYGTEPPAEIVVGPTQRRHAGVPGLLGESHAAALLKFHTRDPSVEMRVARSSEDFSSVPPDRRVHWWEVDAHRERTRR